MNKILIIAKKDMRSFFLSPMFYLIAGICSLIWAAKFIFDLGNFASRAAMSSFQTGADGSGGPNIMLEVFATHLSYVNFIMILAVAGLTMRMFSEEQRNRTFDLLLTSPVTSTQITIGKFLGGLSIAWTLLGIGFLFPILVAPMAKFDWGHLFAQYVGMLLIVGCYVAIGAVMSSLTSHPVLAVIFSLIGNVMLWFIGMYLQDGEGPFWGAVKDQLTVNIHLSNFLRGSVTISGLVFFMSLIGLCVFITQRVVESHRWR